MKNKYILILILVVPFLASCGGQKRNKIKDAAAFQALAMDAMIMQGEDGRTKAVELLNEAIKLNPNEASFYQQKAKIQHDNGNIADALETLELAIALTPEEAELLATKGVFLQNKKDSAEAIINFEKAIRLYDARIAAGTEKESSIFNKYLLKAKTDNDINGNIEAMQRAMQSDTSLAKVDLTYYIEVIKRLGN